MDRCTIYLLIGGTYTPILLCSIRPRSPLLAWTLFAYVWGVSIAAIILIAVDLKRYTALSMISYLGLGWSILLTTRMLLDTLSPDGFWWLSAGGIAYSIGAVLLGLGRRYRYLHSLFHLVAMVGSILHAVLIIRYVI